MFVSPIDVVGDGLDELSDAGDGEAFELPSREFTEEALNEIQPRGGGRGEVELHSRVFLEPYPNSRMLVRGVVVENDVDVELGRDGPLDLTEESQEFLMPMARHAFVEDLASGHVQSSEEGRGTVTFVVMRHRSSTPFLQGQARLGAVQGLDLALLVESEDHGPLRGVDVEAHHITELLDELGIRGQLEVVDAVRLKAMSLPDTRYRGRCTPTSLAMRRQLQCVASAGLSSSVLRTISASSSGVICRGRPERGLSWSKASIPSAS